MRGCCIEKMIGKDFVVSSCLASIYAPIIYDLMFEFWCIPTQPTTAGILYILLIGLMQPILMLIFVCLTLRNVRRSRQRVVSTSTLSLKINSGDYLF
jgi:hypothetical protein